MDYKRLTYDQLKDTEHKQNNNKGTRMVKDGED